MNVTAYRNASNLNGTSVPLAEVAKKIIASQLLAEKTMRARTLVGKEYDDFKDTELMAIAYAGVFKPGHRHADRGTHKGRGVCRKNGLVEGSGLVFVEVDHLDDPYAEIRRLAGVESVTLAYPSVSGKGVHAVIRVNPTPTTRRAYKAAWSAAMDACGLNDKGDQQVSNIGRIAFLAHCPNPLVNLNAPPLDYEIPEEPAPAPPRVQPNEPSQERTNVGVALAFIQPSDYDTFLKVGMALHDAERNGKLAGSGFNMWKAWASDSPHFRENGHRYCLEKWDSFGRDGITLGTLFALAKQAGYIPPAKADANRSVRVRRQVEQAKSVMSKTAVRAAVRMMVEPGTLDDGVYCAERNCDRLIKNAEFCENHQN